MNVGDVLICKNKLKYNNDVINIGERCLITGNSPINRDFYGEDIFEIETNTAKVCLKLKYVNEHFNTIQEHRNRIISDLI